MALHEAYVALRATGLRKVVFILDASESAASHQAAITALVRDVLSFLPVTAVSKLYFLGNPTAYVPRYFASRAAQWFQENRQRASLVTPVWETLDPHEQSALVVVGSGCLFDLEDWQGTPLLQGVLLVSMEHSLQGAPAIAPELLAPTTQELLQWLHDPVVSVEMVGPGFLPTWWDNTGYRQDLVKDEVLLGAERLKDFSVTLRCLAEQDGYIEAVMTHESGAQVSAPLETIDPIGLESATVGLLSIEETSIFHRAIRKESFRCLLCSKQHPWTTLRCLGGASILGELVYPSLQAHNVVGFVTLRIVEDGVQFEIHQGSALPLGSGAVAVREGQRAVLYQYDERRERWRRGDKALEPYHPLGEQAYAILV